jgi:hypothetical protein
MLEEQETEKEKDKEKKSDTTSSVDPTEIKLSEDQNKRYSNATFARFCLIF